MQCVTADEAVTRIIANVQSIRGEPAEDAALTMYANKFVGFVLDFADLSRSLAGHNRASDHTDDTSDDEDLGTTLPKLKSGFANHTGCLFHNFVRFHFDSFQLIGVTRGILINHSPRTSKISASRRSDHPYFVSV